MKSKESLLFMCIGNSCRSQMAEGFMRFYFGDAFHVFSAGVRSSQLNPYAVKVMKEIDIDISSHTSKTSAEIILEFENGKREEFQSKNFDYLITVCKDGEENCPYIATNKGVLHHGFPDPPKVTEHFTSEEEKMTVYRDVRDQIKSFILKLPEKLKEL